MLNHAGSGVEISVLQACHRTLGLRRFQLAEFGRISAEVVSRGWQESFEA